MVTQSWLRDSTPGSLDTTLYCTLLLLIPIWNYYRWTIYAHIFLQIKLFWTSPCCVVLFVFIKFTVRLKVSRVQAMRGVRFKLYTCKLLHQIKTYRAGKKNCQEFWDKINCWFYSFTLQCNPSWMWGNFGLKLQKSPKLPCMLDYIVM